VSGRLRERFRQGKREGRALFVAYVTAGYPRREDTVPILLALEAGGADVIELGVPFSDPLADGATIQQANQVALAQGVTFADCLAFVRTARIAGLTAPVLLMGYYNPILQYGEARAARDAAAAGVDGFIVVDLPPDEAGHFLAACRANDLSFVPLVAPTTPDTRIPLLAGAADAFLYCVSVTGTTGKGNVAVDELPAFLGRVRAQTDLPLAVGFGITRREHVAAVGKVADAAVIGSAILGAIDRADESNRAARVREFVEEVTGRRE
jgi:tryptophan synthase